MGFEIKSGMGFIFRNKNKTANIHPEYKGEIRTPNGELLDIALWVKENDKGKYFSASVTEKQKNVKTKPPKKDGDDLPF